MSKVFNESLNFLLLLSSDNKHSSLLQKKALIRYSSKAQQTAIRECFINLVAGNVPLSDLQKKQLLKHYKVIESLARKKTLSTGILVQKTNIISLVLKSMRPFLISK